MLTGEKPFDGENPVSIAIKHMQMTPKKITEINSSIPEGLEEITIKESRSVMLIADSGGSFLGAKFSYFSEDEHTFMGFGGIRYMEVNYTDAEWADFVKANNNDLSTEYKKSE